MRNTQVRISKIIRLVLVAIKKTLPHERYLFPVLSRIIQLLDFLHPKDNQLIIFGSNNGKYITGSPGALFKYIKNNNVGFRGKYFQISPKEKDHFNAFSFKGILTFLRARTMVSSHGLNDFSFLRASRRKLHICTWHGIMFKSSGYLCKMSDRERKNLDEYISSIDLVLSSSYFDASTVNLAYNHGAKRMKLVGHPRNDHLVNCTLTGKSRLKEIIPWLQGDENIVLYAPTFRDKAMGPERMKLRIFPFTDFEFQTLSKYLETNNIVLLVRWHLNDVVSDRIHSSNRIINFNFDVCPDINYVLSDIDALVTDYSSIMWDYLLLNRPILFVPYDLEEFSRTRGFIIDDFTLWTPGPSVSSLKDLIHQLRAMLDPRNDEYSRKRLFLQKIVHSHQTENSSLRILNIIRNQFN